MFKANDNMRPGPTPERVFAICRLVEMNSYSNSELFRACALNPDVPLGDEYIRRSIEASEELGLIKKENNKYVLAISRDSLASANSFRKAITPIIFLNKESTFFKLTEWYIKNADRAMNLNKFDEFAADAAKTGVESVTENDVLGWRFWMRFLGFAYQYNKTLIPNMKVRLENALSGIEKNTSMTCTQFVSWLKNNVPEAATACNGPHLPLAISNGMRTLKNEGKIDLISTRDAVRINLYPLRGVDVNDFSDIVIKEIE